MIEPVEGDLYLILEDHLLVATMNACDSKGLVPGRDVGLIAINDGLFYDHLPVPISVLTADFYGMGVAAARFVMTGSVPAGPVDTRLIVRQSLLPEA